MNINKQHLIGDIKYFEDQENLQIMLRDGCDKSSGDYKYHQETLETYLRAQIAFRLLLERARQ